MLNSIDGDRENAAQVLKDKAKLIGLEDTRGYNLGEEEEEEPVIEEEGGHPLPNIMEIAFQLEKAGVGLGSIETVHLNLAIKNLVNQQPVSTARFWGKIFGTQQNYYVVETEFNEGEDNVEEEEEEEHESGNDAGNTADMEDFEDEDGATRDVLPKSKWKATPKAPREPNQIGVNKKVYFVCHDLGLQWIRLPPVTPEHIAISRTITSAFTGNLDAPVFSAPPFPGKEANYLRAQIARIGASTQISPEGFYHFGGDGEEEEEEELDDEEGGERQRYSKNEEYEPLPMKELASPNMQHWVHHTSYILPQGRVSWWNPNQNLDEELDDFDEGEEGDEEEGKAAPIYLPERGPPILTSVATDAHLYGQASWSVRLSSNSVPEQATVVASSILWPGAFAVAWGKQYENCYIGWGIKGTGPGFQNYLPPDVLVEYEDTPEISETIDPTPEDEAALRKAQNVEEEEEEGEGEDGEDGEEEED